MYMMRLVYHCQRGKTPDVVACLKTLKELYTSDGCTNGTVYVDRMGRMDRAIFQFEFQSLMHFRSCAGTIRRPQPRRTAASGWLGRRCGQGARESTK